MLLALFIAGGSPAALALNPTLWGYGVRSCSDYEQASAAAESGSPAEYQRYQDWVAGFVSGLNLAVDEDVLSGSGIETLMRRTLSHCKAHPSDDFFTATMNLIRQLSSLR
ncbi:hypothetical protein [Halochromatium sp.]